MMTRLRAALVSICLASAAPVAAIAEEGAIPPCPDQSDVREKVPLWLKEVGPDMLVNKRSTTWRGLSEADKAAIEQGKAEALLIANPTLIKRPVIETGADVYVGWTKDVQAVF